MSKTSTVVWTQPFWGSLEEISRGLQNCQWQILDSCCVSCSFRSTPIHLPGWRASAHAPLQSASVQSEPLPHWAVGSLNLQGQLPLAPIRSHPGVASGFFNGKNLSANDWRKYKNRSQAQVHTIRSFELEAFFRASSKMQTYVPCCNWFQAFSASSSSAFYCLYNWGRQEPCSTWTAWVDFKPGHSSLQKSTHLLNQVGSFPFQERGEQRKWKCKLEIPFGCVKTNEWHQSLLSWSLFLVETNPIGSASPIFLTPCHILNTTWLNATSIVILGSSFPHFITG